MRPSLVPSEAGARIVGDSRRSFSVPSRREDRAARARGAAPLPTGFAGREGAHNVMQTFRAVPNPRRPRSSGSSRGPDERAFLVV